MRKDEKSLSLRIDADLLKRFEHVAKYNDRSINGMLLHLVRKCIAAFETENGKIEINEEK